MDFIKRVNKECRSYVLVLLLVFGVFFCSASFLHAGDSEVVVKKLVQSLKSYDNSNQSVERIEEVLVLSFLGKRVMNLYWDEMAAEQQSEFLSLFLKLVRKLAYDKCSKYFTSNQYRFVSERIIEKKDFLLGKARDTLTLHEVKLSVDLKEKTGTARETVNFLMHKSEGKFIVFDVEILQGSLVKDYRNQFASIIKESGITGLLKTLEEKLNQ